MLQNIFSHRPPLYDVFDKAELCVLHESCYLLVVGVLIYLLSINTVFGLVIELLRLLLAIYCLNLNGISFVLCKPDRKNNCSVLKDCNFMVDIFVETMGGLSSFVQK